MKQPQKQPGKTPSLRFQFQKAVQRTVQDHPELKKNTVFINAKNYRWLGNSHLLSQIHEDEDARKIIQEEIRVCRKDNTSCVQQVTLDNGKTVQAVIFHSAMNTNLAFAEHDALVDDTCTFEHETGHALSPGSTSTRMGENIADAYAMIRHIQRSGQQAAKDIGYCGWRRALSLVKMGVTTHLTTFTLDQIICDSATANFISLSPRETIAIAKAYAKLHTPKKRELAQPLEDFKPLKDIQSLTQSFEKMAEITLKAPEDSKTFYLGARVLSGILKAGENGIFADGQKIVLSGLKWKITQWKLAKKLKKLPTRHPLRLSGAGSY